jgi:succinate dehydrogenase / fumarate reductase, iron-sulfur subunit
MANLTLHLKIWRQGGPNVPGKFVEYTLSDLSPDMSFLEMLDVLNEKLTRSDQVPVEFDSDCREGICGSCGMIINGQAHGPELGSATCQLYLRAFQDGQTVVIEPWRARAFPMIKDLVVDRTALDRIVEAGGYISVKAGPHVDGNTHLIPKPAADYSFEAATCIQCGACVAACPNASASLFTGAQIAKFAVLPQGKVESLDRTALMVEQMDKEGFGHCTNIGECEAACPKSISLDVISMMRKEYRKSMLASESHAKGRSKKDGIGE